MKTIYEILRTLFIAASICLIVISASPSRAEDSIDWSGVHAGGFAGVSFHDADSDGVAKNLGGNDRWVPADVPIVNNAINNMNLNGCSEVFGVETGYSYQSGPWVMGIDLIGKISNLSDSATKTTPYAGGGSFTIKSSMSSNWAASIAPRIGYAFDRWLVSGHAGVTLADIKVSADFVDHTGLTGSSSKRDIACGYSAGLEVGYALNDRWSINTDYTYTKFNSVKSPLTNTTRLGITYTSVFQQEYTLKTHAITIGLNYKF